MISCPLSCRGEYEPFALRIRVDVQIDPHGIYPRVSAKSAVLLSIRHLKNLRGTQRFYREVVRTTQKNSPASEIAHAHADFQSHPHYGGRQQAQDHSGIHWTSEFENR